MFVVDASVAVKWFFAGEDDAEAATRVLDAIIADPRHFAVPELFFCEMVAVLCKAEKIHKTELTEYIEALELLGLHRVGNGHELLATAARLALQWGLSGYDAVYLATAKLIDGVWLTADATALRRINDSSLAVHIVDWRQAP